MKPGIHFIFLILLQGFAGTLQAQDSSSKKATPNKATSNKPISYAAIDQRAIKAPPSAEKSVESLAEYLGNTSQKASALTPTPVAFDIVAADSTPTIEEGSLWNNDLWADNLSPLSQASNSASALAPTLMDSVRKPPAALATDSRHWMTENHLPVDLIDFLFINEPTSMAGDMLERKVQQMSGR